jgi:cation:H+ antiporter
VFVIGGIIVLVVGASLFVNGASTIAKFMGIPDAVIGLTVLAVGTSLPELATSIVAAYKGEGDISIGNVIGSNIFNILSILGIVAIIHPIVIGEISMSGAFSPVDLGMMLFVALVIGPLARTQLVISRLEGLFLLSIYVGYLFYLYTKMAV